MPYAGDPGVATINGASYDPVSLAFPGGAPANGIYWGLPPLGVDPDYSGAVWNDTLIRFIGERTGIGRKRLSYEARTAWIDLVFVNTPVDAPNLKDALINGLMELPRYSVQLPNRAQLNGFSLMPMTRCATKIFSSGKIAILCPLTFQQLSDEN